LEMDWIRQALLSWRIDDDFLVHIQLRLNNTRNRKSRPCYILDENNDVINIHMLTFAKSK
jgi:hypothetical protein